MTTLGPQVRALRGGVNAQTANYLAVSGDAGKLISMNGTSLTLTLPAAPPSSTWFIAIENRNGSALTVSRNGLNIDGAAANLTLQQNEGVFIFTDGSNYFTQRASRSGCRPSLASLLMVSARRQGLARRAISKCRSQGRSRAGRCSRTRVGRLNSR